MKTFETTLQQLPKPILSKLRSVIRRIRRLQWFRGILATIAVGLLCLLAIMAVDASITLFSHRARWALSLSGVAITLLSCFWFLVRPLSKKISLTHVARALEIQHPELQERISTAVELMSSSDSNEIKGSQELIEAVVDSAVLDVEQVDPRKEFNTGKARKFIAIGLACLGLLALTLIIFPNQGFTLLKRAIAPHLNIGNAYADSIEITPGNTSIPEGEPISITMSVKHKRLKRAEVRRLLSDGTESVERLTLQSKSDDGRQRFSITFNSVEESFQYRIRAGSGLSEYYTIETLPPPIIETQTIRYTYPAYTQLEPKEFEDVTGNIKAVTHTKVIVTSTTNKPIKSAITLLNESDELGLTTIDQTTITNQFDLTKNTNGSWQIDLVDHDDFENQKIAYSVQSVPDQKPEIRITNPTAKELTLKPVEVLPISYQVTEDYGFSELVLVASVNGETEPRIITQPLPKNNQTGVWQGQAELNLASLKLNQTHRRINVHIRVRDNLPQKYSGPAEAISDSITVYIKQNAKSLAEQTIENQKDLLEDVIRDTRRTLMQAERKIRTAEREVGRKEELTTAVKNQLDDFDDQAKSAAFELKQAADQLKDSVFSKQAKELTEIATNEINQARENAQNIPSEDNRGQRTKQASEARKKIEKALDQLRDVEDSIDDAKDQLETIEKLNEMANEQRQLARDTEQLAEQDKTRQQQLAQTNSEQRKKQIEAERERELDKFKDRQNDIKEEMGELLNEDKSALKEALKPQQQKAKDLAQQAKDLAEKQAKLQKTSPDEAKQQQQQLATQSAELAKAAKQLEDSLEDLDQRKPKYEARHAANFLKDASNKAKQATTQMQQNNDKRTEQEQRSAQQALETAAQSLQKSAQQIGEQIQSLAEQESGALSQGADSQQMAESFQQMNQSAQAKNAQQAAEQAEQAAKSLQELAQHSMQQLGQIGSGPSQAGKLENSESLQLAQNPNRQPNDQFTDTKPSELQVPPELQELGISTNDWARIKGSLTGGGATAIDTNLPEEYRELVGRYFRIIANEANKQ